MLIPYLTNYSVEYLALRGEFVSIWCLVRAMLTSSFWRGRPVQSYVDAFIRTVSPRVILTYIDNDKVFYTISNRFPNIKTVFLQNGSRSEVGDIFGSLVRSDQYRVDYMLVHGLAIGKHYTNFVSGSLVIAGSLRNNAVRRSFVSNSQSILFISQFLEKPKHNEPLLTEPNGAKIYWNKFFTVEILLIPLLGKWCVENKKIFRICGRSVEKKGPEFEFYSELLGGVKWEYIPKSITRSSYELVDDAGIVVFVDSTLGYESIGRGKRAASFSARGWSLNNDATRFGWPSALPETGPFWTNHVDENEVRRVLDYLAAVGDEDWERTRRRFGSELMEYDPENLRFRTLLTQLIPNK